MTARLNVRRRSSFTTVTVEAEVDIGEVIDDLDDESLDNMGLHRAENCSAKLPVAEAPDDTAIRDAIASLHRQAHPSGGHTPWLCREEPCRSLPLELVATSISNAQRAADAYKAHMAARENA